MAVEQPFMQFDKLAFRCYYPQEIRQLSVLEIKETKTFDDVGCRSKFTMVKLVPLHR